MKHNRYIQALALFLVCAAFHTSAQQPVRANGKFVEVDALKIYYEESGNGMPVLLLHHFFATTSMWDAYVPVLAEHYRVINIDFPGHGRSDYMDTTSIFSHKQAAEYLIGFIDQLELDSVWLIGASSGGFICMYIATMRPDLVKRLIIIGGQVYYSRQTRQVITECCNIPPEPYKVDLHGSTKANLLQKQFYHFRQVYGDMAFTPDLLSTIIAKTLIIHGDNDDIAPLSNALEMHAHIPSSHLWIVPHGGHMPVRSKNHENDCIRKFLEFLRGDWD